MRGQERYASSWADWAEAQGGQTAEQWQQYFEKVVRPQWLRDPVSKREEMKKRVEKKQEEEYHKQGQSIDQDASESAKSNVQVAESEVSQEEAPERPSGFDDERFEELLKDKQSDGILSAYTLYAREKKQETLDTQPSWSFSECLQVQFQSNHR